MKKYPWGTPDKRLVKGNRILCPSCVVNDAILDNMYGVMKCKVCADRFSKFKGPSGNWPEFVPNKMKVDREKHWNDIVQPFRGGEASKEFMEAYPSKAKKMFTETERKKAKHVWKDLPGWQHRAKTGKGKKVK